MGYPSEGQQTNDLDGILGTRPAQQAAQGGEAGAVSSRYKDAYIVGRALVGLGGVVKFIGFALGLVVMLFFISLGANSPFGSEGMIFGVVAGVVIGVLIYIPGALLAAQGQILKATLDTAVNSSPFLTNDQRAEVMSLK